MTMKREEKGKKRATQIAGKYKEKKELSFMLL